MSKGRISATSACGFSRPGAKRCIVKLTMSSSGKRGLRAAVATGIRKQFNGNTFVLGRKGVKGRAKALAFISSGNVTMSDTCCQMGRALLNGIYRSLFVDSGGVCVLSRGKTGGNNRKLLAVTGTADLRGRGICSGAALS